MVRLSAWVAWALYGAAAVALALGVTNVIAGLILLSVQVPFNLEPAHRLEAFTQLAAGALWALVASGIALTSKRLASVASRLILGFSSARSVS